MKHNFFRITNYAFIFYNTDFILTTLLPLVFPPTSWYKITISDAQESFILHLYSVSDYERKIPEIVAKNFSFNSTIQPFIIVEGINSNDIKSYFVHFDKNFL